MKINLKGLAENLLFALDVFLLFLLLFGNKVSIPVWLQPLGRMHPMLLHFPITLLMLAMLLEFFRFRAVYAKETLYQNFTTGLLLTGSLLAVLTAIMGIFLSKEPAYGGNLLSWHKWTGAGVVFVASLVYWSRERGWYRAPVARSGALLVILGLIFAGHYGAVLTHGENFVMEPISKPAAGSRVPLEDARVFEDVVMPIFSQKCLNCHNPDKAKGGLVMSDLKGLGKGGKTGRLFVPGKPEISLLLQRLHLPEDDKKHMPPKDQTQLTAGEMDILYHWVKQNAVTDKKVADLPADDSLRMVSAVYLAPAEVPDEDYDFSAADEDDIRKLSNNYRVIYPLARNSPALLVNFYNKANFKPELLKELEILKKQIIALNLSGMPLKDEDLKLISGFRNLRKLSLNYSDIKGQGLQELTGLEHLHSLSLSGTEVSAKAVHDFLKKSTVKHLALWNTPVKGKQLQQLQTDNRQVRIEGGFRDEGKPIKLNQPKLNAEGSLYSEPFRLEATHPVRGVSIRYTLDGSQPDSLNSALYTAPIPVGEDIVFTARAYKKGWTASDPLVLPLYRNRHKADSVVHVQGPRPDLNGGGPPALIDGRFGSLNIYNGFWIGYVDNPMESLLFYKQPVEVSSVGLNVVSQVKNAFFPPLSFEVWGGPDKQHLRMLGMVKSGAFRQDDPEKIYNMVARFKPVRLSCIRVVARNLKKIPSWYPDQKMKPIMFVDEVLVN